MDMHFATFLVTVLIFLDNLMTVKILNLYRKCNPDDNEWYENEMNSTGRIIFKHFGSGISALMLNLIHSYAIMGVIIYMSIILDIDMIESFIYIAIGGLLVVNRQHYRNYTYLKEKIKET